MSDKTTPEVRNLFEIIGKFIDESFLPIVTNSNNWLNLSINIVAGLILWVLTVLLFGAFLEWRREPARRNLFKRLVREALTIASHCERIVSLEGVSSEGNGKLEKSGHAILNDRFNVNIGWANVSTLQFNEQLALFSGTLDYKKVDDFSKISSRVAKIRVGLHYLRKYVGRFEEELGFYGQHDPNHSELRDETRVMIDPLDKTSVTLSGQEYQVLKLLPDQTNPVEHDENAEIEREEKWRQNFASVMANLLFDVTRMCLSIQQYSRKRQGLLRKYPKLQALRLRKKPDLLAQTEAELKEEDGLRIYSISDMIDIVEKKRMAILDDGLYMVKHVVSPTVVKPRQDGEAGTKPL